MNNVIDFTGYKKGEEAFVQCSTCYEPLIAVCLVQSPLVVTALVCIMCEKAFSVVSGYLNEASND